MHRRRRPACGRHDHRNSDAGSHTDRALDPLADRDRHRSAADAQSNSNVDGGAARDRIVDTRVGSDGHSDVGAGCNDVTDSEGGTRIDGRASGEPAYGRCGTNRSDIAV